MLQAGPSRCSPGTVRSAPGRPGGCGRCTPRSSLRPWSAPWKRVLGTWSMNSVAWRNVGGMMTARAPTSTAIATAYIDTMARMRLALGPAFPPGHPGLQDPDDGIQQVSQGTAEHEGEQGASRQHQQPDDDNEAGSDQYETGPPSLRSNVHVVHGPPCKLTQQSVDRSRFPGLRGFPPVSGYRMPREPSTNALNSSTGYPKDDEPASQDSRDFRISTRRPPRVAPLQSMC